MSEPISLAAKRAEKQGDGTLWEPLDCLKQLIADIEAGLIEPTGVHISLKTEMPDGRIRLRWYQAKLQRTEQIALMALTQKELLEAWSE